MQSVDEGGPEFRHSYVDTWSPRCLAGKVAIVTGASSGVGAEVAQALAAVGCRVYSLTRNPAAVQNHAGITPIEADAGSERDVQRAVRHVRLETGRIDIAVANAARYTTATLSALDLQLWDAELRVNLTGAFFLFQSAAEVMVRQRAGSLIAIGSTAGQRGGTAGHAAYGASKAGVEGFCKGAARELGPYGIRVNVLALGSIAGTGISAEVNRVRPGSHGAKGHLGRPGTVEEAAHACVFLASGASSFVTGSVLRVDGGGLYASP